MALFDEYQSRETAKHVLRSMKENARQGYWNGARPPYGYKAVAVEQRGARIKKRLAIDVVEAEDVRLIYRFFLEGHGGTGPMGIKAIVNWLNANGHRTRSGATCARQGKTVCKGLSIQMEKLDHLVTSHLIDRLLAPERLEQLLAAVAVHRAERSAAVDERIAGLHARADEADERLRRLYKMVEDGVAALDDLLRGRIAALNADRETAHAALDRARGTNRTPIVIPGEKFEGFGQLMRERLTEGEIPFRKAYLGAIVDRVEVDDHQIRICGRKDVLEHAVAANGAPFRVFAVLFRDGAPYGSCTAAICQLFQSLRSSVPANVSHQCGTASWHRTTFRTQVDVTFYLADQSHPAAHAHTIRTSPCATVTSPMRSTIPAET